MYALIRGGPAGETGGCLHGFKARRFKARVGFLVLFCLKPNYLAAFDVYLNCKTIVFGFGFLNLPLMEITCGGLGPSFPALRSFQASTSHCPHPLHLPCPVHSSQTVPHSHFTLQTIEPAGAEASPAADSGHRASPPLLSPLASPEPLLFPPRPSSLGPASA